MTEKRFEEYDNGFEDKIKNEYFETNKEIVDRLTIALSILFTILCGIVLYGFYKVMGKPANFKDWLALLFMPVLSIGGGIAIWVMGREKMNKVRKFIHLTQDSSLFNFVKKRQG